MKDIVRLEAATASSNASARMYAPLMVPVGHGGVQGRPDGGQDRVSVSPAAQKLSEQAVAVQVGASSERLASLRDRVLTDSLEIDFFGIAEHLTHDLSRE
jgi:hypothetical protein